MLSQGKKERNFSRCTNRTPRSTSLVEKFYTPLLSAEVIVSFSFRFRLHSLLPLTLAPLANRNTSSSIKSSFADPTDLQSGWHYQVMNESLPK
jgi:hypothetical protein